MTELLKPLPEKVGDYAGARVAAVAEFRAANPGVPMDEIRVELSSKGIRVYRSVVVGSLYCPKIVPDPTGLPDLTRRFDG